MISIVVGDKIQEFSEEDVTRAERIKGVKVECPYKNTRKLAKITMPLMGCEARVLKALRGGSHYNINRRRDIQ
jgi:hypothetical protein